MEALRIAARGHQQCRRRVGSNTVAVYKSRGYSTCEVLQVGLQVLYLLVQLIVAPS